MKRKKKPEVEVVYAEEFVGISDLTIALANAKTKLANMEVLPGSVGTIGSVEIVRVDSYLHLRIKAE